MNGRNRKKIDLKNKIDIFEKMLFTRQNKSIRKCALSYTNTKQMKLSVVVSMCATLQVDGMVDSV
jgi:hypothetical protein